MIVKCNLKCRESDGFTDGSLDVKNDDVICNNCGEVLSEVSSYTKLSMKVNGDIIRHKSSRAFMFPCNTCEKPVEAVVEAGLLIGRDCPNDGVGCKINITEHMVNAIEQINEASTLEGKDGSE